jgi:kynurenine formamidase
LILCITREMLEAAQDRAQVSVQAGDIMLLRTGWLAERGVAVVGADNFAIEAIPFPVGQVFPVHHCLLREYGMPLIEGLALAPLADTGVSEFLFVAAPLPITGGTASPLAPVVIL